MRNTGATGPPVSYQSVKLARGKHSSPSEEVCVMELASMLAGEPFSDHPRSACPVIGAFLRAYNDRLDEHWRQDLYEYAAKVVGTRSTIEIECQRARMCREWVRQTPAEGASPAELVDRTRPPGRFRRWLRIYCHRPEYAGHRAAITFGRRELDHGGHLLDDGLHRQALHFIDELIAVDRREEPQVDNPDGIAVKQQPAQTW